MMCLNLKFCWGHNLLFFGLDHGLFIHYNYYYSQHLCVCGCTKHLIAVSVFSCLTRFLTSWNLYMQDSVLLYYYNRHCFGGV